MIINTNVHDNTRNVQIMIAAQTEGHLCIFTLGKIIARYVFREEIVTIINTNACVQIQSTCFLFSFNYSFSSNNLHTCIHTYAV